MQPDEHAARTSCHETHRMFYAARLNALSIRWFKLFAIAVIAPHGRAERLVDRSPLSG
jgi:hypothetical protein